MLVFAQVAQHIAYLMISATLNRVLVAENRINRTPQCLAAINYEQAKSIRFTDRSVCFASWRVAPLVPMLALVENLKQEFLTSQAKSQPPPEPAQSVL